MESYHFNQKGSQFLLNEVNYQHQFRKTTNDQEKEVTEIGTEWINEQIMKYEQSHPSSLKLIKALDNDQNFDFIVTKMDISEICIDISASSSKSSSYETINHHNQNQNKKQQFQVSEKRAIKKSFFNDIQIESILKQFTKGLNEQGQKPVQNIQDKELQIQELYDQIVKPIYKIGKNKIQQNKSDQTFKSQIFKKYPAYKQKTNQFQEDLQIYYFDTFQILKTSIPSDMKQLEACHKIMNMFIKDKNFDQKLMKYPNAPMAYKLEPKSKNSILKLKNSHEILYDIKENDEKVSNKQQQFKFAQDSDSEIEIEEGNNQLNSQIFQFKEKPFINLKSTIQEILNKNPQATIIQIDDTKRNISSYLDVQPSVIIVDILQQMVSNSPDLYNSLEYKIMLKYDCFNFVERVLDDNMEVKNLPIKNLEITKNKLVYVENYRSVYLNSNILKKKTYQIYIDTDLTIGDLMDQLIEIDEEYNREDYKIYFKLYEYEENDDKSPVLQDSTQIKTLPFLKFNIINVEDINETKKNRNLLEQPLNLNNNDNYIYYSEDKKVIRQQSAWGHNDQSSGYINCDQFVKHDIQKLTLMLSYEEFNLFHLIKGQKVPMILGIDYFDLIYCYQKESLSKKSVYKRVKAFLKFLVSMMIENYSPKNNKFKRIPFTKVIEINVNDKQIVIEYYKGEMKNKKLVMEIDPVNIIKESKEAQLCEQKIKQKMNDMLTNILTKLRTIQDQRKIELNFEDQQ